MIRVRVPATSANLGPGFDTLGLALTLYLEVAAEPAPGGINLSFTGTGQEIVMGKPGSNLLLAAMEKVFVSSGEDLPGLNIYICNNIPLGKGLGSSAAAIVAGLFLANRLLGEPYPRQQLIKWAVEMEGHADNIVPAVAGGLTTVLLNQAEILYQSINLEENIGTVVAVPAFALPTEQSRAVLPGGVSREQTVQNLQQVAYLLASLYNRQYEKLSEAMDDHLAQPWRMQLVPGLEMVINAAVSAGALGAALSGAGPSVLALTRGREEEIAAAMKKAFHAFGVQCQLLPLGIDKGGITWIED